VIIIAVGLITALIIYHRNIVIVCTGEAGEFVKTNWEKFDTPSSAQAMYNFLYRNCMGKRGFER
jgi:hypothetical protein